MVNTKIRLIIFFAAKDGESLYSQQKQDQELTVAEIILRRRQDLTNQYTPCSLVQAYQDKDENSLRKPACEEI